MKYQTEESRLEARRISRRKWLNKPGNKAVQYQANQKTQSSRHKRWRETHKDDLRIKSAKERAVKLQRIPLWSNQQEIVEFYMSCPNGYHVDHILPLRGKTVSGLHVLENLQYLTKRENLSKGNKICQNSKLLW